MDKIMDYIVVDSKNSEQQLKIKVQTRNFAEEIVKQLVAERKRQCITQQEIADATGIKAPNVTRIESCKYTPTLNVLKKYSEEVGKELHFNLVDTKKSKSEEL